MESKTARKWYPLRILRRVRRSPMRRRTPRIRTTRRRASPRRKWFRRKESRDGEAVSFRHSGGAASLRLSGGGGAERRGHLGGAPTAVGDLPRAFILSHHGGRAGQLAWGASS